MYLNYAQCNGKVPIRQESHVLSLFFPHSGQKLDSLNFCPKQTRKSESRLQRMRHHNCTPPPLPTQPGPSIVKQSSTGAQLLPRNIVKPISRRKKVASRATREHLVERWRRFGVRRRSIGWRQKFGEKPQQGEIGKSNNIVTLNIPWDGKQGKTYKSFTRQKIGRKTSDHGSCVHQPDARVRDQLD